MDQRRFAEELQAAYKKLVHALDRLSCDGTRTDHNAEPGDRPDPVIREGAVCRGMAVLGELKSDLAHMIEKAEKS